MVVMVITMLLFTDRAALKRAALLLNMKHGIARLDTIWGMGGGQRPVVFLVKQVRRPLRHTPL